MEARDHHYYFAHYYLRDIFYNDPTEFIKQSNDEGNAYAKHLWDIFSYSNVDVIQNRLGSEGLTVTAIKTGGFAGTVYVMPETLGYAEAIMICALGKLTTEKAGEFNLLHPKYFTLELSEDDEGDARTVLGMWDHQGSHYNMGNGPSPSVKEFEHACITRFAGTDGLFKRFTSRIHRWLRWHELD